MKKESNLILFNRKNLRQKNFLNNNQTIYSGTNYNLLKSG
jgi:hypothetical protein